MSAGNPIEQIAKSVYSALFINLPEIEYLSQTWQQRRDNIQGVTKKRRPNEDDIEVVVFPQTWGSTSLGFGGIGGQAMTSAYVVIVSNNFGDSSVFFGGRHAYTVTGNAAFFEDMRKQSMCDVGAHGKYIENP